MAVYSSPGLRADATETIAKLAEDYWVPHNKSSWLQYDPQVIVDVYKKEILGSGFAIRKVMLLEFSQYLENYLWSHYDPKSASSAHLMSIVVMVNEKFRERVPAWQTFISKPEHFPEFFGKVMESALDENFTFSLREQTALLVFLIHCFNSMEVSLIREQIQRLVSLSAWRTLLPERREYEFRRFPKLKKFWAYIEKNDKKLDEDAYKKIVYEREFLSKLINRFFKYLESVPPTKDVPELDKPAMEVVHYCERFLELMIDLEALLPTRRFFNTIMDNTHLVVQCRLSVLAQRKEGRLFSQLLDRLNFYSRFEISDQTGEELKDHDMMQIHYDSITALQKAAFKGFPDLRRFALCNVANVDTREKLLNHFGTLQTKDLHAIAASLFLVPAPKSDSEGSPYSHSFLKELLISRHEKRQSQLDSLNEMPLYPTETIIWDENVVPSEYFSGEGCLALPKLNLQFLTLHDYLLRNFHLFRLESTYEIRQDIEDAISRLKPWQTEDGGVMFGGWARMAQAIVNFAIVEVGKPNIGEKQPSKVRADVTVHLNVRREIKAEWEALRKHDVCFLITVRPVCTPGTPYNYKEPFVPQVGLTYVRGCEIEGLLDLNGRVIEEGPEPKPVLPGDSRTYRVWMDCNQYKLDMDRNVKGTEDVYETFNILMRRKPKENNFKAVLETIRDLMNTECVVPDWLHDIILGYGDPGAAHYSKMSNQIATLNFNDTFLNMDHLRASFGEKCDIHVDVDDPRKLEPPFKVTFCDVKQQQVAAKSKKPKDKLEAEETRSKEKILVTPHVAKSRGPYPSERAKKNAVPFTPTQVEAIRAGMQPGLTIIVGPPGTGKTDVAVQIISNLYHNFPDQRTLLVTHSNQALNQLFEKIMMLDMDERHLLRLGHGEEALETEKDFSRYGRVNYVLGKRLQLLEEVSRLQESLGVTGDVSYTCETAGYFYLYQVLSRWEEFLSRVKLSANSKQTPQSIQEHFPFGKFFSNAPQPLFHGISFEADMEKAESCFRYIKDIFAQLDEFRAFELLRSGLDRSRYLLVKEAKVIAMTCTHAALKRRELVELGFKYDNILMEESAQILEIETFIPLLLQTPQDGYNRLKRWIMIGDHHQLPPVVKNMAFQKYCNMEQSLFTRFVRLGVPVVQLDGQGRSRPSLCDLYNWRYKDLGNLPHVIEWPEYRTGNAGFCFDYQLIDVGDFNGVGESEPNPYFYQNLAEAEYVVAVFTYMRLLGYPAERISILTTYNGQKHLIRDVVRQRCQDNPLVGCPLKVTTVDKYQGQQNDYVLLSLVRTRAVGHLRDVRRLVVAMSRARLGLYVFARTALFRDCFELGPTFSLLLQRPTQLWLAPWEAHPTMRPNSVPPQGEPFVVTGMTQMAQFVFDFYQQRVEALTAQLRAHKAVYEKPALAAPAKERQPAMVASSEAKPASDSKADEADKTIHEEQSEKPEEGVAAHHEVSSQQPSATSAAEETRPVEEAAAQQDQEMESDSEDNTTSAKPKQ
ncbi:RNA helicase aquarius [Ixodes scapularis]|uniref:RNA helicase aquarius n=1 Tax=Ixodes scapularis TaxID=6945 RepID=UPI001C38ED92|nr:RNA helicase aquarius [Ixodes scapularis]